VPVVVDGKVIGAVGVSGETPAQDEEIAIAGANAINEMVSGKASASASGDGKVSYFDKTTVQDAFAKGAVLFNGNDKYMVHTSRRDKAGIAEVHTKDTDIIYVQEGSATFVTGGTAVEPKPTAPDKIRGPEITGGLWILSAEGKHLGTIKGPEHPHNLAWGDDDGKTLYLTAQTGLYRIRLNIPGVRPGVG
jgi:hypothetical protein